MNKIVKESDLRKRLINRVLDLTPVELLNELFKLRFGMYINRNVDWDIQDGQNIITKFLPNKE